MNDLSPEARALLELASGEDSPTGEDRVRVRRALAASISAGALASSAPAAASTKAALGAAAGASGTLAKSTVGIWLVVGAVAGLAGSAAVFVGTRAKSPSTTSAQEHGVVPAKTPAPAQPATPAAAPESPQITPSAAAPQLEAAQPAPAPQSARTTNNAGPLLPRASHASAVSGVSEAVHVASPPLTAPTPPPPAAPPPPAPPAVTSLGPETALLESARAALGRGDAPSALALLERHEREFPTGTLVEERLAAKVLALCSLGRRDEAARSASRLLRMSPNSPLRARILDSCAYER